jgi:trehalose utilization protein
VRTLKFGTQELTNFSSRRSIALVLSFSNHRAMFRITFALALFAATFVSAKDIRVVVWDEQQPKQKEAYTNFLGNQIALHLRTLPGLAVKSVKMDDPQQGLADDVLDNCDVLIWWGHARHKEIANEKAKQIVERIKSGKLSLIALHSAHWAEPFVEAMRERAKEDAVKLLPGAKIPVEYVTPPRFEAPKPNSPLTPRVDITNAPDGSKLARVTLPRCVFPAWRADGEPSHVTTLLPSHPIAREVPTQFDIEHTEMYNEPFHVPKPDAVVFEERWDKGEHFRSGCVWSVGKGKVFYFRPGHETYSVYTAPIPLKIVSNAVLWLGGAVK